MHAILRSGCALCLNMAVFCENLTFYCKNIGYIVSFLSENIDYNLASKQCLGPILNSAFIYRSFIEYTWFIDKTMEWLKWESLVKIGRFLGYNLWMTLQREKNKIFKSVQNEVVHSMLGLLFQDLKLNYAGLCWKQNIFIGWTYRQASCFLPLDDLEILILTIPMKS